jgi:lipopolysaccharide/colanic/teichoic acid biosynthesis glycosyltransferase
MNLAVSPGIEIPFVAHPRSERVHERARHYDRVAKVSARHWRKLLRRRERVSHVAREGAYRLVKRGLDFTLAAALLILLSPLLLFVALAIKLTDGGSVLFWQKRVGMWGQLFEFPKFRSMVVGADRMVETLIDHNHHGSSITFKIKRDPRVTWVGRFIRRFSLDEFPQMWCVLKGEMSLVGPRPALPREVDNYTQFDRRRLGVRPGLTCIWQVSGRADVPFEGQVKMDIDYVERHNFWLDLKLVASTVPAVLSGRGAY